MHNKMRSNALFTTMNPKKNILTILLLVVAMMLRAQSFTLSGKVSDEEGNAVELATISCLEQGAVTMANLKGEYSLKLQSADSVVIKYSMVGYQTRTRVLRRPKGNQRLLVTLHPMKALDEVVVTERRRQTTSTEQLDTKDLKRTPSTTGNAVEELVQQQAGVSTHNELSSQYNVRGGSFDENSVYINNVEVYRPLLIRSGQQEGLSVINSDMVEKIGFSSGGFEAKYGDKMSSTLDIQYRKPTRWEANLQASLLGASGFVGYGSKKFTMSHGIRYKTNRYLLGSLETKNAGSSSLKFTMFELPEEKVIISGTFEKIGIDGSFYTIKYNGAKDKKEVDLKDHTEAVKILLKELKAYKVIKSYDEIDGVGHRLVHGGDKYTESIIIDDDVMDTVEELIPLAPLHNPANLVGVRSFKEVLPKTPMVAVFDTAFHQTMKEDEFLYAVPYDWYEKFGVHRRRRHHRLRHVHRHPQRRLRLHRPDRRRGKELCSRAVRRRIQKGQRCCREGQCRDEGPC